MENQEQLETRLLPHPGGWMEPVTLDLSYWKAFDWLIRQPRLSIAKFMIDCEEMRVYCCFNQVLESYVCTFYNGLIDLYEKYNVKPPP